MSSSSDGNVDGIKSPWDIAQMRSENRYNQDNRKPVKRQDRKRGGKYAAGALSRAVTLN
jgi:hypothetical protein